MEPSRGLSMGGGRESGGRTEEAVRRAGWMEGEEGGRGAGTDDTWMKELQPGGSAEIRVTLENRRGLAAAQEQEAGELERQLLRLRPAPATAPPSERRPKKPKSAESCWWRSCPFFFSPPMIFHPFRDKRLKCFRTFALQRASKLS